MDFGLSNAFSSLAQRFGLGAALLGVTLLVVVFLIMRYALSKMERDRVDRAATIEKERKEQDAKIDDARRMATADQADRTRLINEVTAAREHNLAIIESHLKQDSAERLTLAKVLTEISVKDQAAVDALREIVLEITLHREEEADRTGKLHLRFDAMKDQIHALDVRVAQKNL